MLYRLSALVLIAITTMIAQLSELPAIASLSSQVNVPSNPQDPEVPTSTAVAKIETELVPTSTLIIGEDLDDPLMLASTQDYSMLVEKSPIAQAQSDTVWHSEVSTVDADAQSVITAYETPVAIAPSTYDGSQQGFADQPSYFSMPYDNTPVAQFYVDPYADHYCDQSFHSHAEQNVNHYADPYVYPSTEHYGNPYSYQTANYYGGQSLIYHSGYNGYEPNYQPAYQPAASAQYANETSYHPALNTDNYSLLQYRRLMRNSAAPDPRELQGQWRGVNKGIATLAIDKRFIKEFKNVNGEIYGDNIDVRQNTLSYEPIQDRRTGTIKRQGKFLVQRPHGIGPFKNSVILNYRKGGNRKLDPSNLIYDRVVKLDDNHMLGRATAKFGPIQIPLAYFVLQRVPE